MIFKASSNLTLGILMSVISGKDALRYLESFADRDIQAQICGVDLTARSIERFVSSGSIDLDNSERRVAETEAVQFGGDEWVFLEQGAYLVTFNEIVKVPLDMMAFALPRSSLLRCGATLECDMGSRIQWAIAIASRGPQPARDTHKRTQGSCSSSSSP